MGVALPEGLVCPWPMLAQNSTLKGERYCPVPSLHYSRTQGSLWGFAYSVFICTELLWLFWGAASCCPPRTHESGLQLCLNIHHDNLASGGRPRLLQNEGRKRVATTEMLGSEGALRDW